MIATLHHSLLAIALITLLELAVIARILLRPHRDPASRNRMGGGRWRAPSVGHARLSAPGRGEHRPSPRGAVARSPQAHAAVSRRWGRGGVRSRRSRASPASLLARPLDQRVPSRGWQHRAPSAELQRQIDAMVADIDSATDHVHVLFYIWLPDHNGSKVVEALKRAAARGVTCRAMADDLGSRTIIRSEHWQAMRAAGVLVAAGLPIGNPLLRAFEGRIDLRNHRKIVVIDDRITYCGSQNCADPEFRVKAKYAPWVDAVMRFEGPIARQNQFLFASDWMTYVDENLDELLSKALPLPMPGGAPAQVIGTGPTVRYSAMPEMFESLMFAARREMVATTPYYVPDESLHNALCTTAYRGVDTTIVFPARNDSWIVGAASRSYYADLLAAGVKIYEYEGGLLHTKSLTLDGEVTLIGSANMDRRSCELNYENNILFHDPALTGAVRERQQEYIARSNRVTKEGVAAWPMSRRLWNNLIATLGPVL